MNKYLLIIIINIISAIALYMQMPKENKLSIKLQIANRMSVGFFDGCMEAKALHKISIGVLQDEVQKCKKAQRIYYGLILGQLNE